MNVRVTHASLMESALTIQTSTHVSAKQEDMELVVNLV